MKPHEISNQYPAFDANQNQEAQLSTSLAEPVLSENTEIPTSAWIVSGTCGMIIVAIAVFSWRQFSTWQRKQDCTSDWDCHQYIPCYNCRFSSRHIPSDQDYLCSIHGVLFIPAGVVAMF